MYIEKLLSMASPPYGLPISINDSCVTSGEKEGLRGELMQMLSMRNGFLAFENALHVFPYISIGSQGDSVGLQAWNDRQLWSGWYMSLTENLFFFGENVFGEQFAIGDEGIVGFDPESGDINYLASSLEEWAGKILLEYPLMTGYPLAHAWQQKHGPIPLGSRLLPKIPFVLGGGFEVDNLYAVDAVKGMRYRAELWEQIRNLPDGAKVKLKVLPLQ